MSEPIEREPALADIRQAAQRIRDGVRRTPVLSDELLDEELGVRAFFKCENLQRGGAFKLRGALNAVRSLDDVQAPRGVITHSSGNHGAALALAARLRGIPACVVMPENTPTLKIANVRREGAEVVLCKPGRVARETTLEELRRTRSMNLVHPYDDYRVICGQGTAALELLEQIPDLDVVMAPVSGGGLIAGTALAVKGLSAHTRVIAAEPAQADDAYRSFRSGERVLLDVADTIADGLRASLGVRNFPIICRHVDDIVRTSESAIVRATRLLLERLRVLVEPSAAVPVAALLERQLPAQGQRIGIIISGGNIDLAASPWLTGAP
jgi:threonine dehydratase